MNGRRTHDNSLNDKVIKIMRGSGGKRVFTAKDFSGLGGNVAVRKVLSRLAEKGTIRRIRHGVYDYPRYSKLLGTWVAPDPDAIARAIAREYGWTITPAGEAALNLLGLSEQVPSQWRYVSNGPTRKYEWAGGTILFLHRANRETAKLSPATAVLVQAIKALGRERLDQSTRAQLRKRFKAGDLARAATETGYVTAWVHETVRQLTESAPERRQRHA